MREEQAGLEKEMLNPKTTIIGNKKFVQGHLWGNEVVTVLSGIGKVAAASTCAYLLQHFSPSCLVLSGVAGAVDPRLCIGDIVIAENLLQHDMDARPLFQQYEIPLTGKITFETDPILNSRLMQASEFVLSQLKPEEKSNKVFQGQIASGDQFINDPYIIKKLKKDLPDLLAVEMEGAAIAQVCFEAKCAFGVLRIISDKADLNAENDFQHFIKTLAAPRNLAILKRFLLASHCGQ